MRTIWILFIGFSLNVQAQFYRIVAPADWVKQIPIEGITMQDTACSSGGTEYLLADHQYHLGQQKAFFRMVTRLSTAEAVQNGSRIEVDVDPSYQKLELHWARLIRNGVVIDQLDPAAINVLQRERDLNTFLYDGTRSMVLELQDVRTGDIIDQAFTVIGNDAAGDGRFHRTVQMAYGVPLAHHHLRFIVPKDRELRLKGHLFDEPAKQNTSRWGEEHVWQRDHIACILPESGTPDWYTEFPEIQATEFKGLEDLRQWAVKQYAIDMRPGSKLQEVLDEISKVEDPTARIDSAIHVVQRHVRYLGLENGISAYQPKPPAVVYKQRFGDCKDRSLLLVAMLRELGIKAWPALVNTSRGETLDRHLPSPALFDHCIVAIEHEGERYWVDPTMAHNRGRLKDRYTPAMGYALIVDPLAKKGWQKMETDEMSTVEILEEFTLDSVGGGTELIAETKYTRREADRVRSWLAGQSSRSISEAYRDFYVADLGEAIIVEPVRIKDDVIENVLVITEHYQFPSLWDTLTGGGMSTNITATFLKAYVDDPVLSVRNTPYGLPVPVDVTQKIIVHMPEDWPVDLTPKQISGNGIHYQSKAMSAGPRIELNYHYRSEDRLILPEEMPDYFAQQQRILDDLMITLSYGTPDATVSTWSQLKGVVIILFILAVCIGGAVTLYQWDPEPHPDAAIMRPTTIGGWMVLPLVGLMFSPIILLKDMLIDNWIFEAPLYVPIDGLRSVLGYHIFNYFTIIHSIGMLCLVIVIMVLFFQRRTNVPVIMKAMYISTFVLLGINVMMYEWLQIAEVSGVTLDTSELARAFFAALLWVPFFHLSTRVRSTFVVRRKQSSFEPMTVERSGTEENKPILMDFDR
ncbi:MAG: DUF3857 domain-containing protein [Bacteroidota bacterium]|nr:DUF3857 domain-containing protein [Bacteroidota bacterium]